MAPLLFHKDVYLPEHARLPVYQGALTLSRHARNVTAGDGVEDAIPLPKEFTGEGATLIEVELDARTGQVTKQVWRQHLDAKSDLCFPMLPGGFVPTFWVNAKSDKHSTLQRGKYVGGSQWRNMRNKLADKKI